MKNNKFLATVLVLIFCLTGANCTADGRSVDVQDGVTPKGIRYWYLSEETLPIVSVSLAFKHAGYMLDPEDKQGLAVMSSSVLMRGTVNDGKSLIRQFKEKGIEVDMHANGDEMLINVKTLAENLDLAFGLLSQCLVGAEIDSKVFDVEKERQKSEVLRNKSDPENLAVQALATAVFGKHPYAYDAMGTLETLGRISKEDIEVYRRENFDLDNMTVSVVGSVSKDDVAAVLDKYLASLNRGQNHKEISNAEPAIGVTEYVKYDSPQSVIVFSGQGLSVDDSKYPILQILNNALGGTDLSSVLMQELRENLGITYHVSSHIQEYGDMGIFSGIFYTDSDTALEGINALLGALKSVKENGLDEKAFQIAKQDILNTFMLSFLNTSSLANVLTKLQLRGKDVSYIANYSARYEDVTLQDVNEFAKDFLGDLTIVEVGMKNNIAETQLAA